MIDTIMRQTHSIIMWTAFVISTNRSEFLIFSPHKSLTWTAVLWLLSADLIIHEETYLEKKEQNICYRNEDDSLWIPWLKQLSIVNLYSIM